MIEYVGWAGAFLLGICGAFEGYRTYKNKRCDVGWGFLLSWISGEVLTAGYVLYTNPDIILLTNYLANVIIISYMLQVKHKQENK